ncbi:PAS domain S-box-containing protein [Actinoplanes lutulentus]|uniref:hybrid sensor histidine kinase/response regulator n=1 Tax=Actinoplanes lutulentus TaxID=1287878 RepID=UPI0018370A82|nr:PAS domain S-box protein [Actinoplanes lutulentus]MBB2940644.1 PAS domain S-box-containing protein [Actinoplanes lutulentus]
MTLLGAISAAAPARLLMFGVVAIGPPLAVATASPLTVLSVGGYTLMIAFAISTWQGLLGSTDQTLRLLTVVCATLVSWSLARHLRTALRATASAAREREMLAAIVDQSSDAIIASALDGTLTAWNRGAERIYGYTANQVIGQPLANLIRPDQPDRLPQVLADLAAGQQIRIDEAQRIRSDGTPFLVSVIVSPIRDEYGMVVAAAATERDITDEKLARQRSERAARMESLGQLAGGIAHDFNNLLAIILNYADFLGEEVSDDGTRDLARIKDAADRAKALTGQLLLFAKREPTEVGIVDLNEVITEAGDLLSRTIGADIQLLCRPRSEALPVYANRGRLDQILLNLVINARDAMPEGGVVVVETDLADVHAEDSTPLPPGQYARLTVSDTGTGMTAEVRDRLFEPFFTTKPADRGTGLGLATVYGIVGDAGGHISVESALGIGTTFRILLPPATENADQVTEPPSESRAGHGELVAVIEDEEYVCDLVLRILRENGYRATALDQSSLADDDLNGVTLLITDIVLPGKSGPALADQMRARHPDLRVLFISGYSDSELRHRYGLGEETRIVQKPFTAVEILAGVGEALSEAHQVRR